MQNLSNILSNPIISNNLSENIAGSINALVTFFKVVGIVFLIYLLFMIIKAIFGIIRDRRIKKIYIMINEMNNKLDKIINEKKFKKK